MQMKSWNCKNVIRRAVCDILHENLTPSSRSHPKLGYHTHNQPSRDTCTSPFMICIVLWCTTNKLKGRVCTYTPSVSGYSGMLERNNFGYFNPLLSLYYESE